MGFVSRTIRHTKRYQEIVSILIKYGLGELVRALKIAENFPFLKVFIPRKNARPVSDFTRWEDIRMVFEELGPTYVKLGQMLSNRPDILPPALIEELSKLQDRVLQVPYEEIESLIEAELKAPITELFTYFDKEPIASASIGQVHRAIMHGGTEVAVKIQRPGIEDTVNVDLEILHNLARLAENNIEQFSALNPTGIVSEFEVHIKEELDYNHERHNIERFRKLTKGDSTVYIPASYRKYSTRHILTMELIKGTKISLIAKDDLPGFDRKLIARRGAELILKQIFMFGFFHADPHPGNIMILENDTVCLLDFGMMGTLMQEQQDQLSSMLMAVERRDSSIITSVLLDITKSTGHEETAEIEYQVHKLVECYIDLPLEEINVSDILESIVQLISRFHLKLPANLTMMAKSMVTIEGVGRQIDPDFQISDLLKKFATQIVRHRLNPKRLGYDWLITALEYRRLFKEVPEYMRVIISKMVKGHFKMEFEHKGLDPMRSTLDVVSYRLVFGLILAALIVGSSILLSIDSPRWPLVPVLGLIGFITGGVAAVIALVISVIRTFRD